MSRVWHIALAIGVATVGYGLLKAQPSKDPEPPVQQQLVQALDSEAEGGAAARLALALSFPTLADEGAQNHIGNPAPFQQLHDHLERSFPLLYEKLHHERVNEYSSLFKWQGSNPSLRPLLAMSHFDVVPAPEGPGYNWTYPPFSGTVADGYIWGRGALDVKVTLLQQMEAVSLLLRQGYVPQRTIYLAFGHDEEVGGTAGAGAISALLQSRGVQLELVLDEGGVVMMDGISGPSFRLVEQPVALVGTAEKGIETWEVVVAGEGGHSSMPPVDGSSVASRISRILAALDANPTATTLAPPTTDWLKALAPGVSWAALRVAMQSSSNWIANPILGQVLGQAGKEVSPFVRTTCGVVKIEAGGIAHNVLPRTGTITINCRVLPAHNASFVGDYLRVVTLKEADHVKLRKLPGSEAGSPVAPASGPVWQLLETAILETLQPAQGLRVAPYLVSGMTDSRYYNSLAGGRVYRFCPHRYTRADIARVHGVDERISEEDFLRGISFYRRMFELASSDVGSEEGGAAGAA
ncbi:N-fatty-acyl-amino acid synthase/hydrolase [Chlorella vulgaris]